MKKDHASIIDKLSAHARASLATGEKIARTAGSTALENEHILYAIFLEKGSVGATILANMKLCKKSFEQHIFGPREQQKVTSVDKALPLSSEAKKLLTDAYALATEFGYPYVGTEHVVYAALDQPTPAFKKIIDHGATHGAQNAATKTPQQKENRTNSQQNPGAHKNPHGGSAQQPSGPVSHDTLAHIGKMFGFDALQGAPDTYDNASILDQFTYDMAEQSAHHVFIGYSEEVSRVVTILGRKSKNNPLLLGEPGVGKTALVEHIARLATKPDAPFHLRGKQVRALDLALLVAGTSFRGEFEQRLKDVIAEASERDDVILFIDEIHTIVGAGNAGGNLDAANILKPALARGDLHIIGATTHREYKQSLHKDAALTRRFGTVVIPEPSAADAIKILSGAKRMYEDHHFIRLSPESICAAVELSTRYIPEHHLPDKAFDLLDETCARLADTLANEPLLTRVKDLEDTVSQYAEEKDELLRAHDYDNAAALQLEEHRAQKELLEAKKELSRVHKKSRYTLTPEDIALTVSKMTNIPVDMILERPLSSIARAQKKLKSAIIGQDHVLTALTQTLSAAATGITSHERPRGSFLFLGPTGVGKTLTAQVLAREVFGSDALIRIDMSEFGERHTTAKLLGAPAGYVGYGEGGTLTEKVRKQPYSVILFDEIEKAHPDTHNILLQILEDGRLTDGEGVTADFRNTIVILTSNIGNHGSVGQVGFDDNQKEKHTEKNLRAAKELLAPELLARLDHILPFSHLEERTLGRIATLELKRLKARLAKKDIVLTYPSTLGLQIAKNIPHTHENARAVRKAIHDDLQHKVAAFMIKNPDATAITVTAKKESFYVS